MPDISMCGDKTCPSATKCYRFMAIPSHYQAYSSFDCKGKDKCESFAYIRPGDKLRSTVGLDKRGRRVRKVAP